MRVVLASASPRRRELIKKIPKLEVEIIPSSVDEHSRETDCAKYVCSLAYVKAKDVFDKTQKNVIGADTIVELNGEILTKPHTYEEAKAMLKKLCGNTHSVLTGLCLIGKKGFVTDFERTYVTFCDYDEQIIEDYIATGSPYDKAGGYGIQDPELAKIVKSVQGDLDNVIGLPTKKLEQMLKFFE